MPVPNSIDDLSTTASSNSPSGNDSPGDGDNFIRALSSFVATLRDKLNGTSATGTVKQPAFDGTASGTLIGASFDDPSFSGTAGGALVWSALQTFAAGVNVGNTDSATASTLDHYLEGTFTPELRFHNATTGIAYTTQSGSYTRIGNRVFASIAIVLSSKGSATGVATIAGLPIAAAQSDVGNVYHSGSLSMTGPVIATIAASGTSLALLQESSGAWGSVTNSECSNSTVFTINIDYRV